MLNKWMMLLTHNASGLKCSQLIADLYLRGDQFNFGQATSIPVGFAWFYLVPPGKYWDITSNLAMTASFQNPFSFNYSLIMLPIE
jgi:hypothetical protein